MSSGVEALRPPLPTVCRWTLWVFGLPFFVLLMAGCALETVGGQTGFMAAPARC